jgi:putative CRISPR-associated protein (TIGR02619 family)
MSILKVVTTVGVSIFENYFKKYDNFKNLFERIKDLNSDKYEEYKTEIGKLKKDIITYSKKEDKNKLSAEIKSLYKLKEEYKNDELLVYLIASDTIASILGAEIIEEILKENFDKKDIEVLFNKKNDLIKGLQVKDRDVFNKEGMRNLIKRMDEIAQKYYYNVVFNISGGYKATIPYLTIMAQINGCHIYYIFEDTEELLRIPPLPINIDENLFSEHAKEFSELENGINENYREWKNDHYDFYNKALPLIEEAEDEVTLSSLGILFWEKYKSNNIIFYSTEESIIIVESDKQTKETFINFISNTQLCENKTEFKNVHFVYDDRNNPIRFFIVKKIT